MKYCLLFVFLVLFWGCHDAQQIAPVISINGITNTSATTILVSVSIPQYGSKTVKEFGIAWAETPTPTIDINKYVYIGKDKPVSYNGLISALKENTTYYFRAYIQSNDNTITYSSETNLKTLLTQITSYSPAIVSTGVEVTINGANFDQNITNVYLNNVKVSALIYDSYIKFNVPFGIQADSLSLAVEVGGIKSLFSKKLKYIRGRWTRVKSLDSYPDFYNTYLKGLNAGGVGLVRGSLDSILYAYYPDTWSQFDLYPEHLGLFIQWFTIDRQLYSLNTHKGWKLDLDTRIWSRIAPLPSVNWFSPESGIAFSVKGNGYVGVGSGKFWKYVPTSDTWTNIAEYPGKNDAYSLTLATSSSGYIIGGEDKFGNLSKEMWRYDPVADIWEQRSSYPGNGKVMFAGFVINDKLYVGCGLTTFNGIYGSYDVNSYQKDFWEYDPVTDKWTQLVDFYEPRYYSYSFALGNKGYAGGGYIYGGSFDLPVFDLWKFELQE